MSLAMNQEDQLQVPIAPSVGDSPARQESPPDFRHTIWAYEVLTFVSSQEGLIVERTTARFVLEWSTTSNDSVIVE